MSEVTISLCDPWLITKEPDPPPPEGVTVEYYPLQLSMDAPTVIDTLVLFIVLPVSVNLLTDWLHEHLIKHGAKSITVHSKKITVEKGELRLILEEYTEKKE
jgi:hypothetical protein